LNDLQCSPVLNESSNIEEWCFEAGADRQIINLKQIEINSDDDSSLESVAAEKND
jgi:hypothetical protein